MNCLNQYCKLAVLTTAIATVSTMASAGHDRDDDAMNLSKAKISLTQAIAAAEAHTNGKAVHAEFDYSKRGMRYDVEVVSGNKVFDVKVNADNGAIISSVEDKDDHDHDHKN